MTESRPRVGELISAGCAVALLILLLATAWYGVAGVPDPTYARPAVSGTETGWDGVSDIRWVIVVTAIVAVGAVVLRISQREHGRQTDASRLVTALGLLCSALLIYRVLIVLPSPDKVIDQKLGALLGLGCALGIALGGHESIVQRREHPATIRHRPRRRAAARAPPRERTAMSKPFARLRFSEWLAAAGAVALVVFLFALNWYNGPQPRHGWQAVATLRWLVLVRGTLL